MPNTDKTILLPQLQRYDQKIKGWADNKFLTKVDIPSIPKATATTLGGVKVGDGLNVTDDGTLSVETHGSETSITTSITATRDNTGTWNVVCNDTYDVIASWFDNYDRVFAWVDSSENSLRPFPRVFVELVKVQEGLIVSTPFTIQYVTPSNNPRVRTGMTTTALCQIFFYTDGSIRFQESYSEVDQYADATEFTNTVNEDISMLALKDGGITSAKLADGAVTAAKLADGNVTKAKLLDRAVTTTKLAPNAVTTDKIKDGAITSAKIAMNAVTAVEIKDDEIDEQKIKANAITVDKIKDGSVTSAKLALGAVDTDNIKEGAIEAVNIRDGGVTSAKLANGAVTVTKLASGSVNEDSIADGAITRAKIADGAVNATKLWSGAVHTDKILDRAVSSAKLSDGAVTSIKLASNAVTTNKIADGAVTATKIADGTITAAKLASNAVTTNKIADGAITKAKLASDVGAGGGAEIAFVTKEGNTTGVVLKDGNSIRFITGNFYCYIINYHIESTKNGSKLIKWQIKDADGNYILPWWMVTETNFQNLSPMASIGGWQDYRTIMGFVPRAKSAKAALATLVPVQDECEQMEAEVAKLEQDWIDNQDDIVAVDGNGVPITITTKKTELEKKKAELEKLREDYFSKLGDWKNEVQE